MKRTEHYTEAERLFDDVTKILEDLNDGNTADALDSAVLQNVILLALVGSVRALTHATLANVRVREVDEIDNSDI